MKIMIVNDKNSKLNAIKMININAKIFAERKIKSEKTIIIDKSGSTELDKEFPADVEVFHTTDDMAVIIKKIIDNYDANQFIFTNSGGLGTNSGFYNKPFRESELVQIINTYNKATLFGIPIKPDFNKFYMNYIKKQETE